MSQTATANGGPLDGREVEVIGTKLVVDEPMVSPGHITIRRHIYHWYSTERGWTAEYRGFTE